MILELARIRVKPGMETAFEEGVRRAAPVFKRAKGCTGMELRRSLEEPDRYCLFVQWQTLENHTSTSAARPTSASGASSSAIALRARPRSSTSARSGMASEGNDKGGA